MNDALVFVQRDGAKQRFALGLDDHQRQQWHECGIFDTRSQRSLFAPSLVLVSNSMAFCQVRVVTSMSVPARYAFAICKLSVGAIDSW